MFWEWEDVATATWKRFTPKLSRVLSDAFQRGDPFENIPWRGGTTSVTFEPIHGLQVNILTSTAHPVRRVTAAHWEARVGHSEWVPYGGAVAAGIEAAYQGFCADGSLGTPLASVDVNLALAGGGGGRYRISFRDADGVRVGRRGEVQCVRRTAAPLQDDSEAQPPVPVPRRSRRNARGGAAAAGTSVGTAGAAGTAASHAAMVSDRFGAAFVDVDALASRCAICLDDDPRDDCGFVELAICRHGFHELCIRTHFGNRPQCPMCMMSYGERTGNQPQGTMKVRFMEAGLMPLGGYPGAGTIIIRYSIPSGIQEDGHPSPGKRFVGASRTAYIPDIPEGRDLLKLLRVAFERKLIFTVGRSMTSGMENCVTWSSVHHKTSPSGGQAAYGWPDPGYFARCKEELRNLGVHE